LNATALVRIAVGVVVERRKAISPWIDFEWRPVGVLAGTPTAVAWTVISTDETTTTYFAGTATIDLHRTETGNYRDNMVSGPHVWVVLRPSGTDPPYNVVAVTVDPAEGEAYTEAGNDLVEPVPMPHDIRDTVEAFIDEHHVERPFFKRQRDGATVRGAGGRATKTESEE
jgi:Protein of unknown function (DUF3305)